MSLIDDCVVTAKDNIKTSVTKLTNPAGINTEPLKNYLPDAGCLVLTKKQIGTGGVQELRFDVADTGGWSDKGAALMNSLRFAEVAGIDYFLLARPTRPDGSAGRLDDFVLQHCKILKQDGKRFLIMYWYLLNSGKSDYVITCWTW